MDTYIIRMRIRQKQSIAVFLVTAIMVVILPFLAYLQYTWLGQLSEQEYQHMQNNLRAAAFHCSVEFNQQVISMMRSIGKHTEGTDDAVMNEVRSRIKQWKTTATYPQLISENIALISKPSMEATNEVREEYGSFFLLRNFSGIVLPLNGNTQKVIFIPLNTGYITSSLLPEFIRTYFLTTGASEYEFVVTDNAGVPYFHSTESAPQYIIATADVVVPFILLPPSRPFPSGLSPQDQNKALPRITGDDARMFEQHPHEQHDDAGFIPPQNNDTRLRGNRGEERQERSRLFIKHRTGSLETVVANNRIRNICISFGVLLLLGASVLFLVISASRAKQLAQQQMDFVAGVSHELRTPLAVLKSAGENLADGVIYEKDHTRKYGELIKNEVVRLSEMVEKALTYANIQSGKQQYEFHLVDISSILNKTLDEVKKRIPGEDFTIANSVATELPRIIGNEIALQSAFENILANAIKYSGETKWAQVTAIVISPTENKRFIEITIQDHGIGIASDSLHKVFIPFYRGQNAIERQIQGSGLGLSITKHIIEAHGGTITLKSTLNIGSTFTIQLPAAADDGETT